MSETTGLQTTILAMLGDQIVELSNAIATAEKAIKKEADEHNRAQQATNAPKRKYACREDWATDVDYVSRCQNAWKLAFITKGVARRKLKEAIALAKRDASNLIVVRDSIEPELTELADVHLEVLSDLLTQAVTVRNKLDAEKPRLKLADVLTRNSAVSQHILNFDFETSIT